MHHSQRRPTQQSGSKDGEHIRRLTVFLDIYEHFKHLEARVKLETCMELSDRTSHVALRLSVRAAGVRMWSILGFECWSLIMYPVPLRIHSYTRR
jgi:hypothetical protein